MHFQVLKTHIEPMQNSILSDACFAWAGWPWMTQAEVWSSAGNFL